MARANQAMSARQKQNQRPSASLCITASAEQARERKKSPIRRKEKAKSFRLLHSGGFVRRRPRPRGRLLHVRHAQLGCLVSLLFGGGVRRRRRRRLCCAHERIKKRLQPREEGNEEDEDDPDMERKRQPQQKTTTTKGPPSPPPVGFALPGSRRHPPGPPVPKNPQNKTSSPARASEGPVHSQPSLGFQPISPAVGRESGVGC